MAHVKIHFFDDETMEGMARDLDFDEPDFLLECDDLGGIENNEMAWVPLSAVKWIELPVSEPLEPETPTRRVAIRFLDGEVLRGHIDGQLRRHRYGVVLHLHPELPGNGNGVRKLGIPFSAVKALFYVRDFDGRHPDDREMPSESYLARRTMAPLLDVLEEMDMLDRLHSGGVLSDEEYASKRTQVLEQL
ncbi:MAG TPA: hypothetical protein VF134_05175 [Candidatus Dormibacteraeota bacterium]